MNTDTSLSNNTLLFHNLDTEDIVSIPQVAILSFIVFTGLYISSLYSYLLFHGIAEFFSIAVCVCIFVICLNCREFIQNGYILFIGIAYFFVAIIDGVHTLAYKGMGVFSGYDANLPTQLWIAARYLQSGSLLVAPFFFSAKPRLERLLVFYSAICVLLFAAIFRGNLFPDCYVEGIGLTHFKIFSEYIITVLLTIALLLLNRHRLQFEPGVFKLLACSIIITIVSELAFTSYVSVYGFFNLFGHFLKILAFYLFYKALVETSLKRPYSIIFKELSEERQKLKAEIEAKERLQKALEVSEERYRTVADFAYDWEYWMNPEGEFLHVSPSCERITGYTVADFMSNPDLIMSIILDDDRELFQQKLADHAMEMGQSVELQVDFRIRHKNGETRWIGQVARAVYGKSHQYLGMRASNRDITSQKNTEGALRESEERFRLIFENAPLGVVHFDSNGVITNCNKVIMEITGAPIDKIIGFNLMTSLENTEVREAVRAALSGKIGQFEGDYTSVLSSKQMCLNVIYAPITDEHGVPTSGMGIFDDITDRKRIEREKERVLADLEQALSEVKKLGGFLPICASCKKIRDDEGYWNEVERYISDHSEAQFSHSICPDCVRTLYPELSEELLGDPRNRQK